MSRYTQPKDNVAREDPFLNHCVWEKYYLTVGIWRAVDAAIDRWLSRPRIGDTRPGSGEVVFRTRDHFRFDGLPKVGMTEEQAKAVAEERHIQAYQCWVCHNWHVGNKSRRAA